MISMNDAHPANAGIDATMAVRDASASVRRSRFACFIVRSVPRLLRALHESRRLEGERVLARYRHLNCDFDKSAE